MTIIKHGKKMDDVKFTCRFCGCEFTAEVFECRRVINKDSVMFSCGCPDCAELCSTTVPKVELT